MARKGHYAIAPDGIEVVQDLSGSFHPLFTGLVADFSQIIGKTVEFCYSDSADKNSSEELIISLKVVPDDTPHCICETVEVPK